MSHFLEMLSRTLSDSGGRLDPDTEPHNIPVRQAGGQARPEVRGWCLCKVAFVGSKGDTSLSWSLRCCCSLVAPLDPSTALCTHCPPPPTHVPLPEASRPSPHRPALPVSLGAWHWMPGPTRGGQSLWAWTAW